MQRDNNDEVMTSRINDNDDHVDVDDDDDEM
jgi:hypothetical protein